MSFAVYPVLELRGARSALERATALLLDSDCLGTEELPGAGGLRAFFPQGTEVGRVRDELRRLLPELTCDEKTPLPERDWLAPWRAGLTPLAVGSRYLVVPSTMDAPPGPRQVLRIDPQRAFGTGSHETTALVVELLERHVSPGQDVLDLGTGSGILAMVAAKQGAMRVLALEPDPDAADCAEANVEANALEHVVSVVTAGVEDHERLEADVVAANISRRVLEPAVQRMWGKLLLSGILVEEATDFERSLPKGARVDERFSLGEWAALVVSRPVEGARA